MNRKVLLLVLAAVALGTVGHSAWNWIQDEHKGTWQGAMNRALMAHAAKRDGEAEQALEEVLPQAEKWWPQSPQVIETLTWLGTFYRGDKKYAQAEPLLNRAVAMAEQAGSPSCFDVGRAKFNLGVIARDQPDEVAAERLFTEAAEILSKDPGRAHGDDAGAYLNLGYLAIQRGDYPEAELNLKKALTGYETGDHLGPNPDMANTQYHLAEVYRFRGKLAEAATLYQAALDIYSQTEGPEGKNTRNVLSTMSLLPQGPGGAARAQNLMRQAMAGSDLASLDGDSLNNLAIIAEAKHQLTEAESLYKKACAAFEKQNGSNDLALARALTDLGNLYRNHEEFDLGKAEPALERALTIRENKLGDEHPDTAESLSDLSLLYFYEKKFSAALLYAKRALPVQEKAYGKDSMDVSTTLNRIGISERDLGQLPEAEAALQRALAIREAKKASDQWIAISMENLASVYELEGQNSKAETLLTRAHKEHPSAYRNP
jgi:tetratricopeptide (TPR) repeat protein